MKPYYKSEAGEIYCGNVFSIIPHLPDKCVQTIVTSPPYWRLCDYGVAGQVGMERTPEEYISKIVETFKLSNRILRDDGTVWLVIGDTYAANRGYQVPQTKDRSRIKRNNGSFNHMPMKAKDVGLNPKNLCGIPWRVALALQKDGWYLRSEIIWLKSNATAESVSDRPTTAHEHIFLFSKSEQYYYNNEDIKENGANKRSVWTVATKSFPGAHFATFPPKLITPCILAGSRPGDVVFDPFLGSGTTFAVSHQYGRRCLAIDISKEYVRNLAIPRIEGVVAQKPLLFKKPEQIKF